MKRKELVNKTWTETESIRTLCHLLKNHPGCLIFLCRKPLTWEGWTVGGLSKLWMISHSSLLRLVSTAGWFRFSSGVDFNGEGLLSLLDFAERLFISVPSSESGILSPWDFNCISPSSFLDSILAVTISIIVGIFMSCQLFGLNEKDSLLMLIFKSEGQPSQLNSSLRCFEEQSN